MFFSQFKIPPREYQQKIADKIIKTKKNTLIVLPTGLGKTLCAALVIKHFVSKNEKAMFLAPTRPLVDQHSKRLKEYLDITPIPITGAIPSLKRKEIYLASNAIGGDSSSIGNYNIIVSTPQCINNDIKNFGDKILNGFACIIFDEAHRAVGKYSYSHIAEVAKNKGILLVGLTASPGGRLEKIKEIMKSLFIEQLEIRTEKEKDVAKYIQPLEIEWVYVELSPEIKEAIKILEEILDEKSKVLKDFAINVSHKTSRSKLSQIYNTLIEHKNLAALSHFSTFYNAFHAIELIETEGPFTFLQFFERLKERKKRIDYRFLKAALLLKDKEHPKMNELLKLLNENHDKKIIIFAQYRDQVNHIVDVLNKSGFSAKRFLGKKGGSSKEQKQTIDDFIQNKFNILVSSSIGEEGIDLPSVDIAIFYEPIPSEIRTIQRRGRVARLKGGKVIILVTKNTRDEIFKWVSLAREKKMYNIVETISKMKTSKKKRNKEKNINKEKKIKLQNQTRIIDYI